MLRKAAVIFAATCGLLVGGAANAIPYTLAATVMWSTGGASGTITGISNAEFNALTNQVCTVIGTASCPASPNTDDVAYFRLTVSSGAIDEFGVSNPFMSTETAGFYDDNTGTDPGPVDPFGQGAIWGNGDAANGYENWNFSGTTEILFVGHNLTELPTSNINFMIEADGAASSANFLGTLVAIPEPATALLLGLGLFGIGIAGRRR